MSSDVEKRLAAVFKSRNLPSKAVMSKISRSDVDSMSLQELDKTLSREKAKLALLKAKNRTVRGDMKKKLDNILHAKKKLEVEMTALEFSKPTKKSLKKMMDLRDRAKSLADRSEKAKSKAVEDGATIVGKMMNIENTVKAIENSQIMKIMKRRRQR
jgi:hypothetical protein